LRVSNRANPERVVQLSASGRESCLEVDSALVDFGAVEVGCRPPVQTFTLTNVCQDTEIISHYVFTNPLGSFVPLFGAFPGTSLPAGGSAKYTFSFEPSMPIWTSPAWESGALLVVAHGSSIQLLAPLKGESYLKSSGFRTDVFANEGSGSLLAPSIQPRDNDGDGIVSAADLRLYVDHQPLLPTDEEGDTVWFWNSEAGAVEFIDGAWPIDAREIRLEYDHVCR
jgi:hypothetical protein